MSTIGSDVKKVKPAASKTDQALSRARRFLKRLDPGAAAFTFQLATDTEPKDKPRPDPLAKHLTLPIDQIEQLAVLNAERAAVWVMINEGDGKGRRAENVRRVRAVFADFDGQITLAVLRQFHLEPHFIVESSPGHYQPYWLVDGLPVEQFEGVQRSIAKMFGTDPVVDPCRVMRVPGFLHQKNPSEPFRVRTVHKNDDLPPYEAERILTTFPPIERPKVAERDFGELPDPLPEEKLARYRKVFSDVFEHEYPSASERDFAMACRAHQHGFPPEKAAAWIRGQRLADGDEKGDRADYVWNTVARAYVATSEEEQSEAIRRPTLISIAEFVRGYQAPEYLIEGLLQRGKLYSTTALTGHGKTAVALCLAIHIGTEKPIGGHRVEKGNVIYFSGENPEDAKARVILMADRLQLNLEELPIYFIEGVFSLDWTDQIRDQVEKIGGAAVIFVDTGPLFQVACGFDDENNNVQALQFALKLRELTRLPGLPATVDLTHPIKNAARDNLLPRGGGALLNEMDGNLTLWAEGERETTELHWAGKFRGPSFEPITFALEKGTCSKLVDAKGREIMSVWAHHIGDRQAARLARRARVDEDNLLITMHDVPTGSMAKWCTVLEWITERGEPQKSRVQRTLKRLADAKLVKSERGRWILTTRGRDEAKRIIEKITA